MQHIQAIDSLLRSLTEAVGVSGHEQAAAKTAMQLLGAYMPAEMDALGSVTGRKTGPGPHILLDAHLDQIGMIVTAVDDAGFLRVAPCGSPDPRIMAAATVTVYGKEPLFGVVATMPPHLAGDDKNKAKDIRDIAIDIGLDKAQATALVSPGDRVELRREYTPLLGTRVSGKSFDDRAGIAVILRCLEKLKNTPCNLTVLFSVQEETGGSGAEAAGFAAEAEEALVVDVSFAAAPGIPAEKSAPMGSGAMVGYAPTLDYAMSRTLEDIAARENIPCTAEVMGGRTSTNADSIQPGRAGVKCGLLSVPIRNMHTGAEVLALADIEAAASLMAAYVTERSR